MNKDEEAVNLAMQLADAEEAKGQAEGKLAGLQAALVVEKGTVAALRTKVPAAFESRKAAGVAVDMFSADEYIEAVEGMDKGELKEALLQGVVQAHLEYLGREGGPNQRKMSMPCSGERSTRVGAKRACIPADSPVP